MANSAATAHTMDVLAALFFMIAGAWLLVALVYSCLVLLFLRLRAQGRLGSIYDDDFGRVHLFGGRCYIPLGCIFRRYIRHLEQQPHRHQLRLMTRDERKRAMEILLLGRSSSSGKSGGSTRSVSKQQPCPTSASKEMEVETIVVQDDEPEDTTNPNENTDLEAADPGGNDQESLQEPVCSICLGEYDDSTSGPAFQSKTCAHQFHQYCIVDWLKRQANTDCPCCRATMVKEDDVWETVQEIRKERRRQLHRRRRMRQRRRDSKASGGGTEPNGNNETAHVGPVDPTEPANGDNDLQP